MATVALAGCSLQQAVVEPETSAEPEAGAEPEASESVEEGPQIEIELTPSPPEPPILTHHWEDDYGYGYDLTVQTAYILTTQDIANSHPDEINVEVTISFTGALENVTAQRNAPNPNIYIQPVWAPDSDLCAFAETSAREGTIRTAFSVNDGSVYDSEWCTLETMPLVFSEGTPNTPIPIAGTVEANGSGTVKIITSESQTEAIIEAIKNPTAWATGRPAQHYDQGDCRFADDDPQRPLLAYVGAVTADAGCRLQPSD